VMPNYTFPGRYAKTPIFLSLADIEQP